jgi:hypothetical protein
MFLIIDLIHFKFMPKLNLRNLVHFHLHYLIGFNPLIHLHPTHYYYFIHQLFKIIDQTMIDLIH